MSGVKHYQRTASRSHEYALQSESSQMANKIQAKRSSSATAIVVTTLLLVSCAAYALTYNAVESLRPILSAAIAIAILLLSTLGRLRLPTKLVQRAVLVGYLGLATGLLAATTTDQHYDALIRYTISLLALTALLTNRLPDFRTLFAGAAMVILAYAAFTALFGSKIVFAGTQRFTPFYGGETAVHSSALTVMAMTIVVWFAPWKLPIRIITLVLGIALIVGYGTATEMIMWAIIICGWWIYHHDKHPAWLALVAFIVLPASLMYRERNSLAEATISARGFDAAGSGRFGSWLERAQIYAQYDWANKLIGTGPYTDYRITEIWWWEPKSAHSDWVTIIMEYGIVGATLLCLYLLSSARLVPTPGKYCILALAVGMLLTNSILDRPAIAAFWGIAIYCSQAWSGSEGHRRQK